MLLGASWFGENSSSGDLHSEMFKDYDLMDIIQDNTFENFNMADDVFTHQEKVKGFGSNNNQTTDNLFCKSSTQSTTTSSPTRMNLFEQLFSSTQNIVNENDVSLTEEITISSNSINNFINNGNLNLMDNKANNNQITKNNLSRKQIELDNDKNVFDIILKDNHVLKKEFLSTPLVSSLPQTLTPSSLPQLSTLPPSSSSLVLSQQQPSSSSQPLSKPVPLRHIKIIHPKPLTSISSSFPSSSSSISKMISTKSLFVKLDVSTLKTPCIQLSKQIHNNNNHKNKNKLTNNLYDKNNVKPNSEVKTNKLSHEKSQRTKRAYKRKANLNNRSKSGAGRKRNVVKKEERVHEIGPGLANLGNTCFLNSTIQCLTHLPPLQHHFLHHHDYCMEWENCVVCDVGRHIKGCFHEDRQAVFKPYNILKLCKAQVPHIRWGRQEDAHDLLRCLLDSMHTNSLQNNHRLRHHHFPHHHHILNRSRLCLGNGDEKERKHKSVDGGSKGGGDKVVNIFFELFSKRFEYNVNQGNNFVNNVEDSNQIFDKNLPSTNHHSLLDSVNIYQSHSVNNLNNKSNGVKNNNKTNNTNNNNDSNNNNNNNDNNNNKKTSLIHDIFAGKLRSQVRCTECGSSTETDDTFLDVCVDISKHQSLHQNLVSFFQEEIIDDGVRAYHCARCNKPVPATKRFSIQQAPQVLTIQLKRYNSSGSKVSKHISFTTTLDILPFTTKEHPKKSTDDNKTENIEDLLNNGFISSDDNVGTSIHNPTTSIPTNTTNKSGNNSDNINNTPSIHTTTEGIINGGRRMVIKGGDGEIGDESGILNGRLGSDVVFDNTVSSHNGMSLSGMPYDGVCQENERIKSMHTSNGAYDSGIRHENINQLNEDIDNTKNFCTLNTNVNLGHSSIQTSQENTIMSINTDTKKEDSQPIQTPSQRPTLLSHHYTLFAVLVHNGCSINNGHYYCYVNSLPKLRSVHNGAVSNGTGGSNEVEDNCSNNADSKLFDKTFSNSTDHPNTNNFKDTSINSATKSAFSSLSSQWYCMNDHQVVACSQEEVMSSEAYMLFYCHLSSLPCHVFSHFIHPQSSIHPACLSFCSNIRNDASKEDSRTNGESELLCKVASIDDTHTAHRHTNDFKTTKDSSHSQTPPIKPPQTPPSNAARISTTDASLHPCLQKPLKSILKHNHADHHTKVGEDKLKHGLVNHGKIIRHDNNNDNDDYGRKNGPMAKAMRSHKTVSSNLNKKNIIKYSLKPISSKNNTHNITNNNKNNNHNNNNIPSYLMNLLKPQKVLPSSSSSSPLTSFKIPLISKSTLNNGEGYNGNEVGYHSNGGNYDNGEDYDHGDGVVETYSQSHGDEDGYHHNYEGDCGGSRHGNQNGGSDEDLDDDRLMICNDEDIGYNDDVELEGESRVDRESVKTPFNIKRLTKNTKCHMVPERNGKFENISKTINVCRVPPLKLRRNYQEKDHYYVVRS